MRLTVAFPLLLALVAPCVVRAGSPGHAECERQFKRLSNGQVVSVPEVRDWGDAREYYFAWNANSNSSMIRTKSGNATGSCIINKRTGNGSVTLNRKDLGEFKATLTR
jgi:hypothetical protein